MKITNIKSSDNWLEVKKSAFTTIDKETTVEPTSEWKTHILKSEHSPIRKLRISLKLEGIKSWVSVHFVRHKFGIEHWVSTSRSDRTGIDRNSLRQDELVNHEIELNAQAAINISNDRLCLQASYETRNTWENVVSAIEIVEPELASMCVKKCVYRGFCPEFNPCGYTDEEAFQLEVMAYRSL